MYFVYVCETCPISWYKPALPSQFRDLARFHALGIVLRRRKPEVFWGAVREACINFRHDQPMEENEKFMRSFQVSSFDLVVASVPELLAIVDKERLRKAVVVGWVQESINEPFASICHMDFWVNNMMFAYDSSGIPDRFKMVDFQLTEIGSPIRDLLFFVYTSASSDALRQVDELLSEYHEELVRYVRLHGEDTDDMGWEAFDKEIAATVKLEFSEVFVMLATIRSEAKVAREATNSTESFTREQGISEQARTRYVEFISDWAKRGWL